MACLWAPATIALLAQAPVAREGSYWVQVVTGRAATTKSGRLQLSTRGDVSLRGEPRPDIAWWMKKRVMARSEQEARQLLEGLRLEAERRGNLSVLSVRLPANAGADAQLRLQVPQSLRDVHILSQAGAIDAENLAGTVKVDTGGGNVRIHEIRGAATIRTGGGTVQLGRLEGPVRCVSGGGRITAEWLGARAELVTAGGEIAVQHAQGPLELRSGGGNIRVERAGSVKATTAGGSIEVLAAQGTVSADTAAGAIKIGSARGLVARTANGTIQLDNVSGSVQASSGLGNLIVRLAGALQNSTLETTAGDITVFIPSNLAVSVEALNQGSSPAGIFSEFAELQPARYGQGFRALGSLNGGGPLLTLTASEGAIYLRKLRETASKPGLPGSKNAMRHFREVKR